MSRLATCAYCKQPIEDAKSVYKQKSYHFQCLQNYKTELKNAARGKDEKRAVTQPSLALDPEYTVLSDYLCTQLSLSRLTPLLAKQISDIRLQHGYSSREILLSLQYFYGYGEGREQEFASTIGIVPYVHDEAMEFWRLSEEANQHNEHCTPTSKTVIHQYKTKPAPFYCPFKMENV